MTDQLYLSVELTQRTLRFKDIKSVVTAARTGMFFATVPASSEGMSHVTTGYQLRDSERVMSFLQNHSYLCSLLPEARHYIGVYFPNTPVALEVADDPESINSQLVAIIIVTSSPDEVSDRLEQFDRAWWLGAIGRARGKLCINVEFA
jgi:hypothetical protein